MQLAGGGGAKAAVGHAVDHHAARATNPFPAIVIERDRLLALLDQPFVHHVEHFQKRHVRADIAGRVGDHPAFAVRVLLPPDVQGQVHVESCSPGLK